MQTLEEMKQGLETKLQDTQVTIEGISLVISKERWFQAAKILKDDPAYRFDYLSCVTGVDYKQYLEVVYHLYSIEKSDKERVGSAAFCLRSGTAPLCGGKEGPLSVKVRTDLEKASLPSVTPIWRSAEFQEREAYDLVGIHFEGHPDLRRILMWDEFQYHPLRKDYTQENQDRSPEEF